MQKNRSFWALCRNITDQEPGDPGVLCRAIFGVSEEILIFWRNIHLCVKVTLLEDNECPGMMERITWPCLCNIYVALLAFRLPVRGSNMSDSEGSDSDGSYGGRKKMRRDEAEEVMILKIFSFDRILKCFLCDFAFHAKCRVKRRTSQMSKSQKGKISLGEMERMTVMRRFLPGYLLAQF